MARIAAVIEARREATEAKLGDLGTCLVLIEMSRERVTRAACITSMQGLLGPADEYLAEATRRIRKVQRDEARQ